MDFSGKTILVTGAASGIGLATAQALAAAGASKLVLVDRDAAQLEQAAFGCETVRRVGDVADPGFWDSETVENLNHAVVNAGVPGVGAITELPFDEWRRVLSVNLDGAFLSLQAAMRAMPSGGSIVAVASAAGLKPEQGIAAYASSKAGLLQLARVAAKEGSAKRIRVNAIAPGGVETPIWHDTEEFAKRASEIGRDAAYAEIAAHGTPLGRFARPEEIAVQILFLLSDRCATVTGATFVSDGGYTL